MKKWDTETDAEFHFENIERWDGGTMAVCASC